MHELCARAALLSLAEAVFVSAGVFWVAHAVVVRFFAMQTGMGSVAKREMRNER